MTCIVDPQRFKHKKALRLAIEAGEPVLITDPSIVRPRTFFSSEIVEGEMVTVTNHPKRQWFAQIERKNGKLEVK
jgi:hypothetical protein